VTVASSKRKIVFDYKDNTPPPEGVKYDAEKCRWELVPWREMEEVAWVLTEGAVKYSDHNWQKVVPKERYVGAVMRHLTAWLSGEERDPESHRHHLAHAICCLLFLMWHDMEEGK
jgi:hypothetical protein